MAGMAAGPGDLSGNGGPAGGLLNLCAQRNLALWRMVQQDRFTLVVQTTAHQARQLEGLAQGRGFKQR